MMDLGIIAATFVVMEPMTYLAHRYVMHGLGWVLHASHHRARVGRFEANDAFPVVFAGLTILAMAAGASWPSVHLLEVVGFGVTAYGMAYMFVHDVYIHARLGKLKSRRYLEWLKESHRIHHLYGAEPYGMLLPVVPAELRTRAAGASFSPT